MYQAMKMPESDALNKCAELSSEIETLEAEMLETLQQIRSATGHELQKLRSTLSEIAAAYDIAIVDADCIINCSQFDCDKPTAHAVVYPQQRKRKSVRIMRQPAIETQLNLM